MNRVIKCGMFLFFINYVEMRIEYNTNEPPAVVRVTQHHPRIKVRSCRLKPDPGPCRASIRMFYFDPEGRGCVDFNWGGCQGNGNRFDTLQQCYETCLTDTLEVKRPRFCELTYDYGFCFGAVKRWYYDRLWKVCKETIYSGCGGNKNNFYNKEQCDLVCRLGRAQHIPDEKPDEDLKKVVIINPPNTTPYRGLQQVFRATNTTVGKLATVNNVMLLG